MSTSRRPILVLATALAALSATGHAAAGPGPQPAAADLLPDLRAIKATDFAVAVDRRGHRWLRLTTEVGNSGQGPLDLRPAAADCNGDGDPRDDRLVFQRIFQDGNRNGVFEPRRDTTYRDQPAGCMHFHPSHDHWHFVGFASYTLINARNGRIVAAATKVSFCAIDTDPRWMDQPGFSSRGRYFECGATAPQGLSVGWGDIYGAGLPGQALDVTRVGPGPYCLITIADPQGRVSESDESNNAAGVRLFLRGGRRVAYRQRPC